MWCYQTRVDKETKQENKTKKHGTGATIETRKKNKVIKQPCGFFFVFVFFVCFFLPLACQETSIKADDVFVFKLYHYARCRKNEDGIVHVAQTDE